MLKLSCKISFIGGFAMSYENLRKYIKSVRTITDFNYLREDYNLVSDLIKL